MVLTNEAINRLGLPAEFEGSTIVFQYQKTGGIFVCPKCHKYLGTPKHTKSGVIVYRNIRPRCPVCETPGIIKNAVNVTRPGAITRAIMRTPLHGNVKAKVVLNKEDKYDKPTARKLALEKLINKAVTVCIL